MSALRRLNIELPGDMADQVRARVESGQYSSESEVIQEGLRALAERDEPLEEWLRNEVVAAYDEWKANPSIGLTIDEVRESLREAREGRQSPG